MNALVPAPAVRTTCPYCGVGCGVRATPDGQGGATIAGDSDHPANFGRLCSKGAALGETLGLGTRLLHPMLREDGTLARTDWDTALGKVADGFKRIVERDGPNAVAFYLSGQLLTEDYYVANKLMKGFLGSANVDTNSRLCMASSVAGHKRAFGTDTVPGLYEDLDQADLIVLVGSNAAWCHPVLFQRMQQNRRERGAKLVVIDPRRTATADEADLHLAIKPGMDTALFCGLLVRLADRDVFDRCYVAKHTNGFEEALKTSSEIAPDVEAVARIAGLGVADIQRFYELFATTERTITCYSQGVNQSAQGTDKVNAIINCHLATGRIGKPGMGPFSLTGQPNAMGGREVGGLANQLAAHMDFSPENVDRVARFWGSPRVAARPGLKAVDLFDAVERGVVKAVWIMSTNPVVSMPDAERVRRALQNCELVVVSDCVRDTDTTRCAHVLLPAAAWGEKAGAVTNSERCISRQRSFMPPPGEAQPDWWIVAQVAKRMGFGPAFDYDGPAAIFREHARLSAFENDGARAFDIGAVASMSDAEYEALQPFQWPHPAGVDSRQRLFADGRFFTASGKAQLVPTPPRAPAFKPDSDYPLVLNTGRVRDQWHTMTRTGRSARLSGHHAEPFVQLHPLDAARFGLTLGDLVEVATAAARIVVRLESTDAVTPGQAFVPMHWGSVFASNARVCTLIPAVVDAISGQPELKAAPVRVRRYEPRWYGFALSRAPLGLPATSYCAVSRGAGYWRYELAGEELPASWPTWADDVLGPGASRIELSDVAGGRYRGAHVENETLQSCVFVATTKSLPSRNWLATLFGAQKVSDADRLAILAGRAPKGTLEAGPVVCSCFAVGRSTLLRAIRGDKLVTVEQIGKALRAGTNCGSCI